MTLKLLTTAVVFKEGTRPLGGKLGGTRRAAEKWKEKKKKKKKVRKM